MQTLRALKKLSKRAVPLLCDLLHDAPPKFFPAEKWDNYTNTRITARKCFERMRSMHGDLMRKGEIKKRAKDGRGWVRMSPPDHPLKGTPMTGGMSGYYEPEWHEETAWDYLSDLVIAEYTDWQGAMDSDGLPKVLRKFRTPADILKGARDLISKRKVPH